MKCERTGSAICGMCVGLMAEHVVCKALVAAMPAELKLPARLVWAIGGSAAAYAVYDKVSEMTEATINGLIDLKEAIADSISDKKDSDKYGMKIVTAECKEC